MVLRKIVQINEELCNGCGVCIPKCAEGALQIVDGKARIIKETYCDGLGACLGQCPQGAIKIIEREAEAFSEEEVHEYLKQKERKPKDERELQKPQWPVKINLIPPKAPFLENAHLLMVADCAPIAMNGFHQQFMAGKTVLIGCPKFDDAREYAAKLTEILKQNSIQDITIARMEVPCCSGLTWAIKQAIQASGKNLPLKEQIINIRGEINE